MSCFDNISTKTSMLKKAFEDLAPPAKRIKSTGTLDSNNVLSTVDDNDDKKSFPDFIYEVVGVNFDTKNNVKVLKVVKFGKESGNSEATIVFCNLYDSW
jgi:hypothetical protein